ncbi:MAG: hypothetical protein OXC26_23610 [Albidovulum sp.]|nr:hypothetical protein [Albidovulum sp.]
MTKRKPKSEQKPKGRPTSRIVKLNATAGTGSSRHVLGSETAGEVRLIGSLG